MVVSLVGFLQSECINTNFIVVCPEFSSPILQPLQSECINTSFIVDCPEFSSPILQPLQSECINTSFIVVCSAAAHAAHAALPHALGHGVSATLTHSH
jgi:hypothetical protein